MPKLTNPTDARLSCRLGFTLDAGESVEITDEQAALLEGTVFVVERARRSAPEVSDTPKREMAKRGAKAAEVTSAPERETRG